MPSIIFRPIASVLFVLGAVIASSDRAAAQSAAKHQETSDIVVTGRRSKSIQLKDVRDTVLPETIKAYGADSIGDLLNRLSARFGRNFSILVNGRRLAVVDAVNALPPEALERIELLKPSKANDYGLPAGEAVINLALRPRFQFMTVEGGGSVTTKGDGDTENAALRYSRIRGDKRFNAAFAYTRQGGLLESDRTDISQTTSDPSAPYRSLISRRNAVTLTAGYAQPLGALNLDLSSQASIGRTDTLSGIVIAGKNALGTPLYGSSTQRGDARLFNLGATLSGNAGRYFWTLLLNGEISWATTANRQGQQIDVAPRDVGSVGTLGPNVVSRTKSVGATSTFGGPLFSIPTGAITVDGSVSLKLNSLSSTVSTVPTSIAANRYTAMTAQGGITVPITHKGPDGLGVLGDLSLAQRFDYMRTSGIGAALTTTTSVDWSPSSRLVLSFGRSSSPGIPSATDLYAPVITRPGVLVYDAITDGLVPVTVISGGRSGILAGKSSSISAQATWQAKLPFANFSAALSYSATQVLNPLVSFSNPSPLAQRLIPELFTRTAEGTLLTFDSRPFSGRDETTRQIAANFHFNGLVADAVPSAKEADTLKPSSGLIWDVNLSWSYALSHKLALSDNGSVIDLLATPLSLSGVGSARHHLNVQWVLGKQNFGLNGTISWDSGSDVQSLTDDAGAAVRYSPLTKIGLEGFVELDRSPDPANPKSLRLKLGIDNIFNQRLRVSGLTGLNDTAQRLLTDPYGRMIRLTLRKSL